jgi:DNA-binding IclR family transcriptional regulator
VSTKNAGANGGPATVKSADRVLRLFEYLADAGPAPFSAIAQDLRLPNSSCHQLLQTVTASGFIEFDAATRMFRIGSRLWEVAQSYAMEEDLAAIAQPLMDELRDDTLETVQLARLEGLENVYVAISESPHPMKLVSAVGSRLSAHATGLGKVLLAGLDPEELERRLDGWNLRGFTDRTITTRKGLRAALAQIRELGYGEDCEEYVIGCRCIAMPVHDAAGKTIAALSVSVPTPRFNDSVARRLQKALGKTVAELEARLQRHSADRRRATA